MTDNTDALPPLPDYIERVLLDYADACFRCGEYPGDDAARYRALNDHRERMWQSVTQTIRAALAAQQNNAARYLFLRQYANGTYKDVLPPSAQRWTGCGLMRKGWIGLTARSSLVAGTA